MELSQYIDKERLVSTFIELVKINSPSFEEKSIGDALAGKLRVLGCRVEIQTYDRSFNLIAFKKGNDHNAPPIILSGHMDTIEPTGGISFSLDHELIKTIGNTVLGADDKSALAQIIEALTVIGERNLPHGDIEVVFTSAEETGLIGAKHVDFSRLAGKHALVLDAGGSVGNLITAAPTHITYEMRVVGRAAHAGVEPEKGLSAISVAAEIISRLPDGRIDSETTANIGIIKGGTATNVVPKEVVINGELRGHDAVVVEKYRGIIFETARSVARERGAKLDVSESEEYRSFRIADDDPFMQYMDGVFRDCGIVPLHVMTGGGSDANIFNQNGIKTINISNGMQRVHSNEEYIYIKDLYNGSLVVLKTLMDFNKFRPA